MAKSSPKLNWCKIRLGKDLNWWVNETSDKINWDYDGLSIIDPKQGAHMFETLETLREYGLDDAIIEKAFIPFVIESKISADEVKLTRTDDSVFDADDLQLFLLPNLVDDEGSEYADFLNHITRLQIKMLNDTFDFEKKLSTNDLEDEIRETYSLDYMEGRAIHTFLEIMDILEYVPEGYSLEDDEEEHTDGEEEEDYSDEIGDIEENDEDIEEDETMQWEDEKEEENYTHYSEDHPHTDDNDHDLSAYSDDEDF